MADKEDMGSVIFLREMQNERRDDATSLVKREWLYPSGRPTWEYEPAELERRLKEAGTNLYVSAVLVGDDPSIGAKFESDYTGRALVIETQYTDGNGHDYWIEALWNEHWTLDTRVKELTKITSLGRRPITQVRVEAIAGFNDYADEIVRRTNLPMHRVDWVKDKISTLESKSHFFENGKVHLNRNIDSRLKDLLVHQLTTNHPKHDDLRDGVLLCLDDRAGLWGWVQ
jgi:hypothetical protein